MPVSVVIPTLNEAASVGAAIDSAFAAGAAEVIVTDGGSSDATLALAQAHGARTIARERVRARQLNAGAEAATSNVLLFLHADTTLPAGACAAAEQALERGAHFGGFRLRFAEPQPTLRIAETLINLRTRITRCPWGDQAQFIARDTFTRAGGYRADLPIMEDYELAVRMKRAGRNDVVPLYVTTSGRRFLEKGVLRTVAINWRIVIAFRLGADPNELASIYRR